MFAVYAESFSPDDPLSGLTVGERPDPEAPDDWVTVQVKAASLNHHDLWSLRGVGLREDYIIPSPFDERVGPAVAAGVAEAARRDGVARRG